MDVIVSDQHGGLVRAIRQHFQGVTWQRCQTHFIRNVLDATPKNMKEDVHRSIRGLLDAPDLETARLWLNKTLETYSEKSERSMRILEQGFDDAVAVMSIPEKYRKRLRTTNSQERLNEEVRRLPCFLQVENVASYPKRFTVQKTHERVIRIFPNRESAYRLLGALLMEMDEKWSNGRKYLDMTDYLEWRKTKGKPVSKIIRLS